MVRKNRTPEENARCEKIRELLPFISLPMPFEMRRKPACYFIAK